MKVDKHRYKENLQVEILLKIRISQNIEIQAQARIQEFIQVTKEVEQGADENRMYLAVAIRCLEMNQTSGDLGEQGQGKGLQKNMLPYWKNPYSDDIYNSRPKSC